MNNLADTHSSIENSRLNGSTGLNGLAVDTREGLLRYHERSLRLEPRLMQVLVALYEAVGRTVTREELIRGVWGHEHVTDDALNRCISQLRKHLRQLRVAEYRIETIPKVGYRLAFDPADSGSDPVRRSAAVRPWWLAGLLVAALLIGWFAMREQSAPQDQSSDVRWVPLTSLPGLEVEPTLSPEGTQAAFAWRDGNTGNWDIYVTTLGGDALARLTDDPAKDRYPKWSPDGRQIAFIRAGDNGCEVMLISPTGGQARRIAVCDPNSDWMLGWTPDSRQLLYSPVQAAGAKGFGILNLATGSSRMLTRPHAKYLGDDDPAVSPDGRWIAFTRWRAAGVGDVYLMPLTGGEPVRITMDSLKIHGLTWTPDSQNIVFASNRGGNFSLWSVSRDGGAPRLLPVPGRALDSPVYSRNGRLLVVEEWTEQSNIWRLDPWASSQPPAPLISSTRWDWHPALSPDQSRLSFVSDRSGAAEIWVSNADGSEPMRLTGFDGPFTNGPAWSPDGSRIAFESPVDGNFDIYLVPAAGGTPQRLTTHGATDRGVSWSRDGQYLYFGSNREDGWQLWRFTLETGDLQRITDNGGYIAQESDDGQWLYFSKHDQPGLWRKPLGGGEEQLVIEELLPLDCSNWRLHRDDLFFVTRENLDQAHLVKMSLTSGERWPITVFEKLRYKSGFSVDREGAVLYSQIDQSESDLMVYYLPVSE